MNRRIAIVGAPSNLGMRPYDDGEARCVNRAPEVLRRRGLVARLTACDAGDVLPPAYREYERPPNRPRNEQELVAFSRQLASRVATATRASHFPLVVGGDCSIALGCVLGAQQGVSGRVGLVYVDAHADFAIPEASTTGSASGMCVSMAVGRARTSLARLAGHQPLVDADHVVLLGRRDQPVEAGDLEQSLILDLTAAQIAEQPVDSLTAATLAHIGSSQLRGFWIHLDVDVLNPTVMPAVDSPIAGGLMPDRLIQLLVPLVRHPHAIGLDVSIYDPALDADRSCARLLVGMLETLCT